MLRRLMNVAALMCASVLDTFRVTLKHGFGIQRLPSTHFLNDGNRLLLFMGTCWVCPLQGLCNLLGYVCLHAMPGSLPSQSHWSCMR